MHAFWIVLSLSVTTADAHMNSETMALPLNASISPATGLVATEWGFKSEVIKIPNGVTEIVPSWEAYTPGDSSVAVYIKVGGRNFAMGEWSETKRTSVNKQENENALVSTDTLILRQPVDEIQFMVELNPGSNGEKPELKHLFWTLSGKAQNPERPWDQRVISPLSVPIRAQGDYPNPDKICSPTSLSMVLGYWAEKIDRPALDRDVVSTCSGVFDPGWDGTGNWSFNTAFAASLPGITGRVARLRGIAELENWLRAGVPVVCSVAYDFLKGKPERSGKDGHLVVVVGVDPEGNLIFNDPGKKPVRLTYMRSNFARAWETSSRTVYLVHPERWLVPVLQ